MTLSCNEGSMRLRPEWPWRAWRYKIAPDESVQYWSLFLFLPPLSMLFFHISSDQWWQYKKCFWRLSLVLQNSIAPSSTLGRLPWRRKWILISSTLHNRRANILLVQHRFKFFHQQEKFLWMSWQNLVFVVLLWPLIGMQNHSHSISTHILRTALLRFLARCCSNPWLTCSIHEQFWPTRENCLCS